MAKAKKQGISAIPASDREWKIKHAADTLLDVQRIKKDKTLFSAALAELKRRRDEANTIIQHGGEAGRALMGK